MQPIRTSSHTIVPTDVRWVNLILVKDDNLTVPHASMHADSLSRALQERGHACKMLRAMIIWSVQVVWQKQVFTRPQKNVPAQDTGWLAAAR